MIEGVLTKELTTYNDERGFFRELIRTTDSFFEEGFGQWSHSMMYPGVIKAWHIHRIQVDWWYVLDGVLKVALYDNRKESTTYCNKMVFMMGDSQPNVIVKIPPGVAHGCKCLSGPSNLFYVTSMVYDPDDELRISYDDPKMDFDWLAGPPIK